jgi:RNA polymerase sigma-70 factor (ECF subfamily)
MFTTRSAELQQLDDNELVIRFRKKRDQMAFAELMNRHQARLYSYLLNMVGDEEVASDLFQDTFTKLISRLDDTYDEQGKFSGWLMRIAHNNAIDYLRRRRRVVSMNATDEEDEGDYFERLPDKDALSPFESMEFEESKRLLLKYIGQLPDEQREVLLMRHYQEMSFKEIADATNVSINTALGRMRYALINLRKLFENENGKSYSYVPK